MLYLVGLGLSDETDITVKGLEVVKKASRVYLEAYTSILLVDQSVLVRLMLSLPLSASLDPGVGHSNAQ
jgi:diphthamide biosynthesis methyltransferase